MREVPIKFALVFLALIMLTTPSFSSYSVSAEEEIDNWPEGDAWLHIELVSWTANQSVEWDNNEGLPDPHFQICIEADGENIDCINTQTWDNQLTLNNSWNYSIDIPDHSNILNITIECRDNDAINDDECDMNPELDEWKLYAEYNWSQTPTLTVIGNGSDDGDETWKNAASEWELGIVIYGDEDSDGVQNNLDLCAGTAIGELLLNNSSYIGCSWAQWDFDGDGVPSQLDVQPFDANIGRVIKGSRVFSDGTQITLPQEYAEQLLSSKYIDLEEDERDMLRIEAGSQYQKDKSGLILSHSPSNSFTGPNYLNCQSIIYSYDYFGSPTNNESTEIIGLNYTIYSDTSESQCNSSQIERKNAHYGTFGDFDGNGIVDFVRGLSNDTEQTYDHCQLFLGISNSPLQFNSPIIIGESVAECGAGDQVDDRMISADLDNDGFDDIISSTNIIFMSDDGIEKVIPLSSSLLGVPYFNNITNSIISDHDSDGDLDILRLSCEDDFQEKGCQAWIHYNDGVLDDDQDGVEDSEDSCPNTNIAQIVDFNGCSSSQKDSDSDGIYDDQDNCPATSWGAAVDSEGCDVTQRDSDADGVTDAYDNCPATSLGTAIDSNGCDATQRDSDDDGVVDSEDECSNTPSGEYVNSVGCESEGNINSGSSQNSDESNSESSDSTTSSFSTSLFCGLVILGLIGAGIGFSTKKNPRQHRVHTPPSRQQHVSIQRQPSQQEVQAQMLHQKQIEAQHLRNQLLQQAIQTQYLQQQLAKQSRSASEMDDMQEELEQLQESKAALEKELEDTSKTTTVVQNITYNIQDSAISGDLNANLNSKDL